MPFIVTIKTKNGHTGYLAGDCKTWKFERKYAGEFRTNDIAIQARCEARAYMSRAAWNKTTVEVVR